MALSTSLVDELHQPTISFSAVYIFLSITAFPGASLSSPCYKQLKT